MITEKLPPLSISPYPVIDFNLHPKSTDLPYKILDHCLSSPACANDFPIILDWLLYQFGDHDIKNIEHIPDILKHHWEYRRYRTNLMGQ